MIISISLCAYSAASYANTNTSGPNWEYVASGAMGLLLLAFSAYAKGVKDTLTDNIKDLKSNIEFNTAELHKIELMVIRDYQARADVPAAFRAEIAPVAMEVKLIHRSLSALHTRIDELSNKS